ncbi:MULTISPECIES: hypothetical protein [Pseudomonas]|uniref:hypothetical protein n=1 Tax=Pseudomonas TaxID=286 RepID=UPI0006D694F1|nr:MULTISPECIES: hypothetical protein [Pseudomonas]KPG99218.1 hypothetical protein AK821_06485 [Pseudomonas sp. RIT-PI-r]
MNKPAHQKPARLAASKKTSIFVRGKDGRISAALLNADVVVERHATKSLASSALSQAGSVKTHSARAPHLSNIERELAELRKVVAALAVRSVAHEEKAADFDVVSITVLDADTAYQLLDSPPEPTEALRNLIALR